MLIHRSDESDRDCECTGQSCLCNAFSTHKNSLALSAKIIKERYDLNQTCSKPWHELLSWFCLAVLEYSHCNSSLSGDSCRWGDVAHAEWILFFQSLAYAWRGKVVLFWKDQVAMHGLPPCERRLWACVYIPWAHASTTGLWEDLRGALHWDWAVVLILKISVNSRI